jgi:hypothetical protein
MTFFDKSLSVFPSPELQYCLSSRECEEPEWLASVAERARTKADDDNAPEG